jgi:zinc protease
VDRIVRQYQAAEAYGRDGTANVASSLNEWIAVGDWTLYASYADKMAKVTPADVQRVAKTYLGHDQSTTGWFVPVETK